MGPPFPEIFLLDFPPFPEIFLLFIQVYYALFFPYQVINFIESTLKSGVVIV